jgi:hypothetical protein
MGGGFNVGQKYFFLKKIKNNKQFTNQFKKNNIILIVDEKNLTNKPKIIFGSQGKINNVLKFMSSKIVFFSQNNFICKTWEVVSGRTLRTFSFLPDFPKKLFLCNTSSVIVMLTAKYILIYCLRTGNILLSIPIKTVFPLTVQTSRRFPVIIFFTKLNNFYILNYQKGYFIKKTRSFDQNCHFNGNINERREFFKNNFNSLSFVSFFNENFHRFRTLEVPLNEFSSNMVIKSENNKTYHFIFQSFVLLKNGKRFHMWDFFTNLLVFF